MSGHFLTLRSKRLKIICVVLEFASIIQYPLLLISPSPKVISLPPCAVLSWHHFIKSSVTVPFLRNRIGWVQLLFKLLLLSLPHTYKTWSSPTKGSNEYNLLFCLAFGSFYCLLNLLSFSSANALLCAIVVFFHQSQFQQCLEVVLMFQFVVAALFCLFLEWLFWSCSSLRNVFLIFLVYQFSLQCCWQRLPFWSQGDQCQCLLLYDLFSMMTLVPKETLVLHIMFLLLLSKFCLTL